MYFFTITLKKSIILARIPAMRFAPCGLRLLKNVANAMDCELVYAIVPRTSLKSILETRAKKIVVEKINHVAHSMSSESKSIGSEIQQKQLEKLIKHLLDRSVKKLWVE